MPFSEHLGVVTVLQNAVAAPAVGTTLALVAGKSVLFELSGTYTTCVVNFQGSIDGGSTWRPISVLSMSIAGRTPVIVSTAPNVGFYRLEDASGLTHVRAEVTGTGTGALTVKAVEGFF